MEIERKYLLKSLPDKLSDYPHKELEQAYLCTGPVVRIRRTKTDREERFTLTYKGGGMMAREEYNLPLSAQGYYHLREKADGFPIAKTRYLVPLPGCEETAVVGNGQMIELDVFHGVFEGLVMAEIEFPDEKSADEVVWPEWFAKEVTFDRRYHNSALTMAGTVPEEV